ncbi:hypothetical protein AGMMS49574_19460 [Bacteroidia bacterium]|nr:hypothetical protein AGMMS49574_19460 [Bacteroidia bacterium]
MHLQLVYADASFYGDGTSESLFEKGLYLPSSSVLSSKDIIDRVIMLFIQIQIQIQSHKTETVA